MLRADFRPAARLGEFSRMASSGTCVSQSSFHGRVGMTGENVASAEPPGQNGRWGAEVRPGQPEDLTHALLGQSAIRT
jgi:hypothetical protein